MRKSQGFFQSSLSLITQMKCARKPNDYSNSLPQCGQHLENHGSFQKNVSQCGQRHQKYDKTQNKIKKIISINTPNSVVVKNL